MTEQLQSVKFKKWGLWFGTFGFALLLLIDGWLFLPQFPLGLFTIFGFGRGAGSRGADSLMMLLGWGIYALLTFLAYTAKNRARYLLIYGIFCGVLLLNVTGCRQVLSGLSDLH